MPVRRLPVKPDLDQLKHQAKDLLRALHAGAPDAIALLVEFHPDAITPGRARLTDAQLVIARRYQASSWPRLVQGVAMADALWRDDALLLRLGARVRDEVGNRLAPVHVVLETDSRKPDQKHAILELYVQHGLELPDTPVNGASPWSHRSAGTSSRGGPDALDPERSGIATSIWRSNRDVTPLSRGRRVTPRSSSASRRCS